MFDPLTRGQFYRVRVRIPHKVTDAVATSAPAGLGQRAAQAEVASAVEETGFSGTRMVAQDPTSPDVWIVLAYWGQRVASLKPTMFPFVQIESVEHVQDPPLARVAGLPSLDEDLSEDEARTLRYALLEEVDPKRLEGFAQTLDVDFPVAASLIRAKSKLEDLGRAHNRVAGAARRIGEIKGVRDRDIIREARTRFGGSRESSKVLDALRVLTSDLDVAGVWDDYDVVVEAASGWRPSALISNEIRSHALARDSVAKSLSTIPARERSRSVGKVISHIATDPAISHAPIKDLARLEGVPHAVARAGIASVIDWGNGIGTVDPIAARAFMGPRPMASPSATGFVHALMRPTISGVANPDALSGKIRALSGSAQRGNAEAYEAAESVATSRRLLDRQNWVQWYDRIAANGGM